MTPFAVTQRAARLATELNGAEYAAGQAELWNVETVLRALHRAGLTLDSDLGESQVKAALLRLGVEP